MHISLRQIKNIFIRETVVYFTTPPAYVFIVIFLLLVGFFTFATEPFGNILNTNETSLCNSFFMYHPWLYLVLIPAIGMRLWSEEKKSGTVELLFTMPISIADAVLGKYLAALFLTTIALFLTFPLVLTVNWLGYPDNNIIICGYLSSFLLAASYLAITSLLSAITKNQIISFIVSFMLCLILALIGHPAITDFFIEWSPVWLTNLLTNLSIFPHFEMLQKGIVDFRDIFYFFSIIFFGLIGSCMVLKNKSVLSFVRLFLIFIIIININCLVDFSRSARFDATQDSLYTLSDGTKSILRKLKYPVTIRYYCSQKDNRLPVQLRSYADRINDLLKEYSVLSHGKIRVQKIDPLPDTDFETSAVIDGIKGQMLKDGTMCYFGLAFSSMDKNEPIPFLNPLGEKTLEYDVTRAIYDVTNFKKPKIGVISSLPVMGGFSGAIPLRTSKNLPWIFVQELQKVFDTETFDSDCDKIDKDVDVLLIVHPKDLPKKLLFAVDQYILNGGKVIAFLDPYCITDSILSSSQYLSVDKIDPTASNLKPLLKAWGIKFSEPNQVVISPMDAYKSQNPMEKEHPAIIDINGKKLDQDNIVTANLNKIDLVFSGAFTGTPIKGLTKDVLIESDPYSELFNNFSIKIPSDYIMNSFKTDDKAKDLCISLTGKFHTAFTKEAEEDKKGLLNSKKASSVILVGDADMLFNPFCVAKKQVYDQTVIDVINSNLDFVLNALDQLSGSQDIIEIRTRGSKKRGFVKFEQIFNVAKKKYRKQITILEGQLQETNDYIKKIQSGVSDQKNIKFDDKQINTIRKYKLQAKETAMKLRDLRKLLRENIESLKAIIELLDIAGPPLIVIIVGLIICVLRYRSYNKED